MEDAKKPWESKTVLVNSVVAAASLYPPASEWIAKNPDIFSCAIAFINLALRSMTGDGISWKIFSKKI